MAVGKLFNADVVASPFELPAEILSQCGHVEFFAAADGGGIGVHFKNVSGRFA